jgi:hypothetical protein
MMAVARVRVDHQACDSAGGFYTGDALCLAEKM